MVIPAECSADVEVLPWLLEHAFVSIENTSRTVCEHDLSVENMNKQGTY